MVDIRFGETGADPVINFRLVTPVPFGLDLSPDVTGNVTMRPRGITRPYAAGRGLLSNSL